MASTLKIDIDAPRYDQSTYIGRAKHFFIVTNPLNALATPSQLDDAKKIVNDYREGRLTNITSEDEIWKAKHLYDSAFHPDTGEKMMILGRMSAQVPMNMSITGCMMTFYKTTPAVLFWQWINQSFNAVVNYTNRSGDSPISAQRLGVSYILATSAAMATALSLNSAVSKLPPIVGRYVPFAAVAAANCVNIPCMRSRELSHGIPVFTDEEGKLGDSVKAARSGISQVVFSRICMAMPGMFIPPVIMNHLEKKGTFKRMPWAAAPLQVGMVGLILIFATPLCCAIFPQRSSMKVTDLEEELQEKIAKMNKSIDVVYFNKGL